MLHFLLQRIHFLPQLAFVIFLLPAIACADGYYHVYGLTEAQFNALSSPYYSPWESGGTYLGMSTDTDTFNGSYDYYVVYSGGADVHVDAFTNQNSQADWPGSLSTGNVYNTENLAGLPDGQTADMRYEQLSYIAFPSGGNWTSITVHVVKKDDPVDTSAHVPGMLPDSWGMYYRQTEGGDGVLYSYEFYDWDGGGARMYTAVMTHPDGTKQVLRVRSLDSLNKEAKNATEPGSEPLMGEMGGEGPTEGRMEVTGDFGDKTASIQEAPPNGNYTIYVYDIAGNRSPAFVDQYTYKNIPPVDSSTISANVSGTMATVSWQQPAGGAAIVHYRIYVYEQGTSNLVYSYYTGNKLQWTIPPGYLSPNTAYVVYVRAYGAHMQFEEDNDSFSEASAPFTTGVATSTPYIDNDAWGGPLSYRVSDYEPPHMDHCIYVYDIGGVPDNIQWVHVIDPSRNSKPLFYSDSYDEGRMGEYCVGDYSQGSMQTGAYTYIVRNRNGQTYSHIVNATPNSLGEVNRGSLSPTNNATLFADTITFDWSDVANAAYWRVRFYRGDDSWISVRNTQSSINVHAGVFKPGALYRWRLGGARDFLENGRKDVTMADWTRMSYNFKVGQGAAGSNAPSIATDGWGAALGHYAQPDQTGTLYYLNFWVKVTDADGVPNNIERVWVEYPDGTELDLPYHSEGDSAAEGYYEGFPREYYSSPSEVQSGVYTLWVRDEDGNTAQVQDNLAPTNVDVPQVTSPTTGDTISRTPTISWNSITGASRYRVRIYGQSDGSYHSAYTPSTSYRVPQSTLAANSAFAFRVYGYKEDPESGDVDNYSCNQFSNSMAPYFYTNDTSQGAYNPALNLLLQD